MSKVYIVTEDVPYEHTNIIGVFSLQDKADAFLLQYKKDSDYYYTVESFDVDGE